MRFLKFVILFLLVATPCFAVTFPTETFDEMSTGALNTQTGGTGWETGGWRTPSTSSCSNGNNYTVENGTIEAGTNAVSNLADLTGNRCMRTFANPVATNGQTAQYWFQTSNTNNRWVVQIFNGDDNIQPKGFYFQTRTTGQFSVIDNVTFRDQGAYSAGTWYHVCAEMTSIGSETWKVYFGTASTCGTLSAAYSWYDNTSYVASSTDNLYLQDAADVSGGNTFYFDEFSDTAGGAAASTPSPSTDEWNWFQILLKPIQRTLARYVNFAYAY